MQADTELDYTSDLAGNIYKLAQLGVRGLAKDMGDQEQVVQNGVDKYFLKNRELGLKKFIIYLED